MNVMLFVPPGGYFAERWSKGSLMPSLGLLYLAAVLEREAVDVSVVPSHVLGMSWRDIFRLVEAERPDLIGITTTTENRFQSFKLARIAKQAYPPGFVVLGGPHCTTTDLDTLSHLRFIDAVVSGEGEETILETVRALMAKEDLKKVRGLSFRKDGAIVQNPPRPLIRDLDKLPLPARHLVPWEKYKFTLALGEEGSVPAASMMTSRGCPFRCMFCATPRNWGRTVRGLSPGAVVNEIEHLVGHYGARAIWFYDDTFNYDPTRTEEICDRILERRLGIRWVCEIRIDRMTKTLLAKMAEAGLSHVGFGVESGSERICREVIGKRITVEKARQVIDWCREFGVRANPFFIFSHPTETWEEALETIEAIESIKDKAEVSASILHVYPGTALEDRALREGVLPTGFSWTRRHDHRVILLPAAQGEVPLYVDRLTWWQISDLVIRYALSTKRVSIARKAIRVLEEIRGLGDLKRHVILLAVYGKHRILRFLRMGRKTPARR